MKVMVPHLTVVMYGPMSQSGHPSPTSVAPWCEGEHKSVPQSTQYNTQQVRHPCHAHIHSRLLFSPAIFETFFSHTFCIIVAVYNI